MALVTVERALWLAVGFYVVFFLYLGREKLLWPVVGLWKGIRKMGRWTEVPKHQYRDEYLKELISQAITDRIEDAVGDGEMTRKEANHWYRRIASSCRMYQLLPQILVIRRNPEDVKAEIAARLEDKAALYAPVPLPDAVAAVEATKEKKVEAKPSVLSMVQAETSQAA